MNSTRLSAFCLEVASDVDEELSGAAGLPLPEEDAAAADTAADDAADTAAAAAVAAPAPPTAGLLVQMRGGIMDVGARCAL